MAARKGKADYVHFRADAELIRAIDEIADGTPSGNRSEVIRTLLRQALGTPSTKSAAIEALFEYAQLQRIMVQRLSQELQSRIPVIFEEVFGADDAGAE